MTNLRRLTSIFTLFVLATLAACSGGGGGGGTPPPAGGGTTGYTIGGTVTGLTGSVVLQNNGGDNLTVSAGNFTFAALVTDGGTYNVSVLTQPTGQTCSVSTGTGTVSGANVTNVAVVCATNAYSVGGTVSGLTGTVVLQNNGGDNRTVATNGSFTFVAPVASGSPYSVTVFTQPTGQSCSVANGAGTITANVSNVVITCASNTYTIGGMVSGLTGTVVLQNNGGNNLTVSTNGTFTFSTALGNSAAYAVAVLTQPTNQTCTVTNGASTVAGGNVTNVSVSCITNTAAIPRFAYVANFNDDTVSMYTVNADTGQLRHNGYIAAGDGPVSVTVDSAGKFAYVVNQTAGTVSAYTINASTGALTSAGAAVPAGNSPRSVTVHPTGQFAYVASYDSGIVVAYTINATTGALTNTDASTAGTNPVSVTVDPTGKFAYVVNYTSNNVSAYTINVTTGALTEIDQNGVAAGTAVATGTNPHSITIDPTGKFAYVVNYTSNNVSAYTINASTGVLTEIDQNGAAAGTAVASGTNPSFVTIDPAGKFAYVTNVVSDNVSAYTINATTGALTSIGAAVAAGDQPRSVTVDPSGKFAYVTNFGGNTVLTYTINASSGALASPKLGVGRSGNYAMAMTRGATAVTYTPKFAYVANANSDDVSAYTINASTGVLTEIDQNGAAAGTTVAAGNGPYSVTVDPTGKFAYVANLSSSNVSAYRIDASTGVLTEIDQNGAAAGTAVATGIAPICVTVDPSGRFAYVANYGTFNVAAGSSVSAYTINATTGVLTSVGAAVATGTNPRSVTVHPSGRFAYVANSNSDNISNYAINASTGVLTSTGVVAAGDGPVSITFDPAGLYAYVANANIDNVSVFVISPIAGTLGTISMPATTGNNPYSVTVDPTGRFAYVANLLDDTISAYTINAATGVLTSTGTAVSAGSTPISVTVDPSGKFVYAANLSMSSGTGVSAYTINATTGTLTSTGTAALTGSSAQSITTTGTIQ